MMDILIIGKNGQLSSELIKLSKKRGINFVSYSRKELDVTNHSSVLLKIKKIKPKCIVNTSSYHVLSECEFHPLKSFEINAVAVGNLAKAAKEVGARFLTISTNYVFDGLKNDKYKEDDRVNPLQVYGLSKLSGEVYALNVYPEGVYVVRTCGLYGNGLIGSPDKNGNFVLRVLDEAVNINIVKASNLEFVNPTNAQDLSEAIIKLLFLKASNPGIYHFINEGKITWYDFANLIIKYKKIRASLVMKNDSSTFYKRPTNSSMYNNKGKKLNIFLPKISDGLYRYLDEIKI